MQASEIKAHVVQYNFEADEVDALLMVIARIDAGEHYAHYRSFEATSEEFN